MYAPLISAHLTFELVRITMQVIFEVFYAAQPAVETNALIPFSSRYSSNNGQQTGTSRS
jgi:hypothetical protein